MGDMPEHSAPDPSTSNSSEWHAIRPWTPHLTLSVREITSVSATFILSSSLDAHRAANEEPVPIFDVPNDVNSDSIIDSRGVISDSISRGLSVEVNGSHWQRFILRTNDHADEAIIVIYGLHPGRQYDIDLALVSGGTMRQQVTTEDAESIAGDNERNDEHGAATSPDTLSPSTNGNGASPTSQSTPSPSQTPSPDDRMRTLTHQLNALHAEQATLQTALKSSRREANKTTTGLRAEIDILKRASEKASIAEGKARQRVRALEDAIRRANDAKEQIELETAADEQDLPGWEEKVSESEAVLRTVKKEADQVRAEREKREEEGRKRKESVKGECATLSQRLERLSVKKERLEKSVVADLEAQLAELERQIEATERGSLQNSDPWDAVQGDSSRGETQRRRQSHPGTIGRPSQTAQWPCQQPIQPISPPSFPRHQPRSQSYRIGNESAASSASLGLAHSSGLHGTSAFAHSTTSGLTHLNSVFPQSPTASSSLSRSTSSVGSSTLSSKAPPFEPTRNLRLSLSSTNTATLPSGSHLSMGGQGSFTSSPTTYAPPGQTSTFSLSGTYSSNQMSSTGGGLGSGQLRLGRSSISKGSTAEDPWVATNG